MILRRSSVAGGGGSFLFGSLLLSGAGLGFVTLLLSGQVECAEKLYVTI